MSCRGNRVVGDTRDWAPPLPPTAEARETSLEGGGSPQWPDHPYWTHRLLSGGFPQDRSS